MTNNIIVEFFDMDENYHMDIEIPVDITALELLGGLAAACRLEFDSNNMSTGYLRSENPVALLKGNKTLSEYGIHDGSKIFFTKRG